MSLQFMMSEQIENIVLLDTSESMFPYYSGTIEYLIEDIVKQQLQSGDSFHLLSFNDFPEYEISRTIRGEVEIRALLNRILLLQPFGQYTDLISAFSYLYEYVDKLPSNSIKRLIILTDGIHDPPPGSPYPVSSNNKDDIVKISENMRRQGWDVTLIQFPLNGHLEVKASDDSDNQLPSNDHLEVKASDDSDNQLPSNDHLEIEGSDVDESDSAKNLFPVIADTLDEEVITFNKENESINHEVTGAPEIIYPGDLGTVGTSFTVDFTIINHSSEPVLLKLDGIMFGNENLLDNKTILKLEPEENKSIKVVINIPEYWEKGRYNSAVELLFTDDFRAFPRKGFLKFNYDPKVPGIKQKFNTRLLLYILIGIVLLIALVYILVKAISSLSLSPSHPGKHSKSDNKYFESNRGLTTNNRYSEISKLKKPGQIAIEMVVKNQNRQIGHRNIHLLEKDHPRSVGGAGSEYFLIFIIATGKRIGEIVLEEGAINFIPKSKDFFPNFKGEKLRNCLNKPIRVVNRDGIETTIIFNEWISPALKLNRIMHLLDKKGLPDFKY